MRKQVWKPNNRERNAGSMESLGLHGIRAGETGRQRQRESKTLTTLLENNTQSILKSVHCVCSMNTFYTNPSQTDRSTHSTSMLIKEPLH